MIDRFSMRFSTRTSMTTRRDYDFTRPKAPLEGHCTTGSGPELEDYRYPVFIDNEKHGRQLARHALERHRSDY
ncbi:contractile injection system protein, VgrG/Pvc8 family, partial [Pseudomonas serbica]|uniref:contractile injection system protein, VgrG/Pvc8 family n=1 Tax=Pseudomonas serbica TaxID=2965074 RepID=UPI0039E6EC9F